MGESVRPYPEVGLLTVLPTSVVTAGCMDRERMDHTHSRKYWALRKEEDIQQFAMTWMDLGSTL